MGQFHQGILKLGVVLGPLWIRCLRKLGRGKRSRPCEELKPENQVKGMEETIVEQEQMASCIECRQWTGFMRTYITAYLQTRYDDGGV